MEAVLVRLRLRRALINTQLHLQKGWKGLSSARKGASRSLELLSRLRETLCYDATRVSPLAFQPELNMRMMAPSPPRAVRILTVPAAAARLDATLTHILAMCEQLPLITRLPQLTAWLAGFTAPSGPAEPAAEGHTGTGAADGLAPMAGVPASPSILVRSALCLIICGVPGTGPDSKVLGQVGAPLLALRGVCAMGLCGSATGEY